MRVKMFQNLSRWLMIVLIFSLFQADHCRASSVSARTLSFAKEGWKVVQTRNFHVTGDVSEKEMRKIAFRLEQFREVFTVLVPETKVERKVPTWVVVFSSHDSFRSFKPEYKGRVRDNVGGYFLSGEDRVYMALSVQTGTVDPFDVIFHEYTHYIMRNSRRNLPAWLNEGLADFYSTFRTEADSREVIIGSPLGYRLNVLRKATLIPLSKLFTVGANSPEYNESTRAGIFYAQSWALVHYLMHGENPSQLRRKQFNHFLSQVTSGVSPEQSLRQIYRVEPRDVEKDLSRYIQKFSFMAMKFILPDKSDGAKEEQANLLSEAETQFVRGDLQMRVGREKEAEKSLRNVLELNDRHAPSFSALGNLFLREYKLSEARIYLEKALSIDPRDPVTYSRMGDLAATEHNYEEAVRQYQQSIALRPDAATVHASLSAALLETGKTEEAVREFDEAKKLDELLLGNFQQMHAYRHFGSGRGREAAVIALSFLAREGWFNSSSPYQALVAATGFLMAGLKAEADKVLDDYASNRDQKEWPGPIAQYLRGRLTREKLLSEAGRDNEHLTEAHAYLGVDLLINNKPDEALVHFNWVKEKGEKRFVEYGFVRDILLRMEKEKKKAAAQ